jgi:hypothetical protein
MYLYIADTVALLWCKHISNRAGKVSEDEGEERKSPISITLIARETFC